MNNDEILKYYLQDVDCLHIPKMRLEALPPFANLMLNQSYCLLKDKQERSWPIDHSPYFQCNEQPVWIERSQPTNFLHQLSGIKFIINKYKNSKTLPPNFNFKLLC